MQNTFDTSSESNAIVLRPTSQLALQPSEPDVSFDFPTIHDPLLTIHYRLLHRLLLLAFQILAALTNPDVIPR